MPFEQAQLSDLHDLVLPEHIASSPQTVGWLIVVTLLALLAVALVRRVWRRHQAQRYRREALVSLAVIERALSRQSSRVQGLTQLPALVKRTVLAFADRPQVASLNGDGWLRYLDATLGGTAFTDGPGRALPLLAYGTPEAIGELGANEIKALTRLIRRWIRRHRVRV